MYANSRPSPPDPEAYLAPRSVSPVSSHSRGAPVTVTRSEKFTAMWMVSPITYVPVRFGDETDTTMGGVSTATRAEPPSERGEPGGGRSAFACIPVAFSAIEPPGPARRACAPTYSSTAASRSAAATSYRNTSVSVPLPEAYRAAPPVLSRSSSGPHARTGASNVTSMSIAAPGPCGPPVAFVVTFATDAVDVRISWTPSSTIAATRA